MGGSVEERTGSGIAARDLDELESKQILHELEAPQQGIRFEHLLSLDGSEWNRLCDRVHEVLGFEALEAREGPRGIFDRRGETAHESREERQQLVAGLGESLVVGSGGGLLIFEQGGACAAIKAIVGARDLLEDAKARGADQQDVERPVGPLLDVGDATETSNLEDRRIAGHRREAIRSNRHHPDLLRPSQRIARHLAIARLEDEERHAALWQEHDIRERKQRQRFDDIHAAELSLAPRR